MARRTRRQKNTRRRRQSLKKGGGSKKRGSTTTKKKGGSAILQCHPLTLKNPNRKLKQSCYTNEQLEKLRDDYNKIPEHAETPIVATDPQEIWEALDQKLQGKCEKEACWLNEIPTTIQSKSIFAPAQPTEWKNNPTTWLTNFDIIHVLEQYEEAYPHFKALEPTSIDFDDDAENTNEQCVDPNFCQFKLATWKNKNKTKIGLVFNLDAHDEAGSHWVSMFIDLEFQFVMYFNSTGEKIPKEIKKLKDRILQQASDLGISLEYYENHLEHQKSNTECGMYSLFFIITLLKSKDKQKALDMFLKERIPDDTVKDFREIYFSLPHGK